MLFRNFLCNLTDLREQFWTASVRCIVKVWLIDGWLSESRVELDINSGLLPTVWESLLRILRTLVITILIIHEWGDSIILVAQRPVREVEHFTVVQINEYHPPTHSLSLRMPAETYNPPKYWSSSVLLDFRHYNGKWAYWHWGTVVNRISNSMRVPLSFC